MDDRGRLNFRVNLRGRKRWSKRGQKRCKKRSGFPAPKVGTADGLKTVPNRSKTVPNEGSAVRSGPKRHLCGPEPVRRGPKKAQNVGRRPLPDTLRKAMLMKLNNRAFWRFLNRVFFGALSVLFRCSDLTVERRSFQCGHPAGWVDGSG